MIKRRVRKPRELNFYMEGVMRIGPCGDEVIMIPTYTKGIHLEKPKDCRRLAKWLIAASAYLEQQEKRRG